MDRKHTLTALEDPMSQLVNGRIRCKRHRLIDTLPAVVQHTINAGFRAAQRAVDGQPLPGDEERVRRAAVASGKVAEFLAGARV